jgi:hypothetical protein
LLPSPPRLRDENAPRYLVAWTSGRVEIYSDLEVGSTTAWTYTTRLPAS